MSAGPGEWLRIIDIPGSGLPAEAQIRLVTLALEELGAAMGLVMIHGPERGARRYAEAGGHIRFGADGEPMVQVPVTPAG
jgi:hypothetical protein